MQKLAKRFEPPLVVSSAPLIDELVRRKQNQSKSQISAIGTGTAFHRPVHVCCPKIKRPFIALPGGHSEVETERHHLFPGIRHTADLDAIQPDGQAVRNVLTSGRQEA